MALKRSFDLNPITIGLHNSTFFEPQRTNHFEVYLYLPDTFGDPDIRSQYQKYITLATSEFSLPTITVQPIEIPYGNSKIKLAGTVEYGGADTLNCTDFIGADVESILYTWQNLVYSPETGQMGWAKSYKSDAKVLEYSADGSCLSSWILFGVWPSSVNYGSSLSKGDSQIKQVSVTLAYDLAYRNYNEDSDRDRHVEAQLDSVKNMTWKAHKDYAETDKWGNPIKTFTQMIGEAEG